MYIAHLNKSTCIFLQDGFPQSVIFDNEHLKLLFEFMNSELEVQQAGRTWGG